MAESVVIVALPPVDDRVSKVSSEKGAHMTLLFLGEADLSEEAILYVQHACRELSPFGMSVDYRGTLGEDDADVLFFDKGAWDMERIADFRHHLLLNNEIKRAYDSAPQYPEWTPHLTLGYPERPANDDDEGAFHYVQFDRIAVWTGDTEGPEFRLKHQDQAMEVAMSDISTADPGTAAPDGLYHYGVKGMRWGVTTNPDGSVTVDQTRVRKSLLSSDKAVTVTQRKPGTYVKSHGGKRQTASTDAVRAQANRQKAKRSTTDSLSNRELKATIERMRLEQEYAKLDKKVSRKGASFAEKMRAAGAMAQAVKDVVDQSRR